MLPPRKQKSKFASALNMAEVMNMAHLCIKNVFKGVMIYLTSSDYQKMWKSYARKGVSVEAEFSRIFDVSSPEEIRKTALTTGHNKDAEIGY